MSFMGAGLTPEQSLVPSLVGARLLQSPDQYSKFENAKKEIEANATSSLWRRAKHALLPRPKYSFDSPDQPNHNHFAESIMLENGFVFYRGGTTINPPLQSSTVTEPQGQAHTPATPQQDIAPLTPCKFMIQFYKFGMKTDDLKIFCDVMMTTHELQGERMLKLEPTETEIDVLSSPDDARLAAVLSQNMKSAVLEYVYKHWLCMYPTIHYNASADSMNGPYTALKMGVSGCVIEIRHETESILNGFVKHLTSPCSDDNVKLGVSVLSRLDTSTLVKVTSMHTWTVGQKTEWRWRVSFAFDSIDESEDESDSESDSEIVDSVRVSLVQLDFWSGPTPIFLKSFNQADMPEVGDEVVCPLVRVVFEGQESAGVKAYVLDPNSIVENGSDASSTAKPGDWLIVPFARANYHTPRAAAIRAPSKHIRELRHYGPPPQAPEQTPTTGKRTHK